MKVKINEEKFSGKFWVIVDNALELYSEKLLNEMFSIYRGLEDELDFDGCLFSDEEDKEILRLADWSDDELYEAVCDEIRHRFITIMDIYIKEGVRIRTETSIDTDNFTFNLDVDNFWHIWNKYGKEY